MTDTRRQLTTHAKGAHPKVHVCAVDYRTEEEEREMERDYEWEHNGASEYDDEGRNAEEQQERREMRQGSQSIAERVAERRRNAP